MAVQGIRANLGQFLLLILVNAFVGGMVGLERTVLPLLAEKDFGLAAKSAALSFIISFGLVKGPFNFLAGRLGDRIGRKKVLLLGWLAGLPVPLLVIWAPSWGWILFANVLLGINQGFCWSMTVTMKIDLAGPARRGLAVGLNEFAGYFSVALVTLASGYVAAASALRPQPFYMGIAFALAGLGVSAFLVRETRGVALAEADRHRAAPGDGAGAAGAARREAPPLGSIFLLTSFRERALSACTQAGMVTNFKDGMAWGLLPLHFASRGLGVDAIGLVAFVYPAVWGVSQLGTGALSDRVGRKRIIALGMAVQAAGIWAILAGRALPQWLAGAAVMGLGTALVYPTLQAAINDVAGPVWRSSALGVYRLWRDWGYAFGAIFSGLVADRFGVPAAIGAVGGVVLLSAAVVAVRMYETLPSRRAAV